MVTLAVAMGDWRLCAVDGRFGTPMASALACRPLVARTKATRYEYRVKFGQKRWSGWLAAGAAKAAIVDTVEKLDYRVQVTAVNGARRSNPTKSLVFTGRGVPFKVV